MHSSVILISHSFHSFHRPPRNDTVNRHYNGVIMGAIASQITSLTIVFSTVYLDTDQRKHQSSASLSFVRGIHRGPVNSPHKWPVTRKMLPFDDVIMLWWRHAKETLPTLLPSPCYILNKPNLFLNKYILYHHHDSTLETCIGSCNIYRRWLLLDVGVESYDIRIRFGRIL